MVEDEDPYEIREDSDSEDPIEEIGMIDVMDLDPEESGEAEEGSSRSLDPATREAEAGESPSEGLVRALQQEKDGEQPVVPDQEEDGE